MQTHKYIWNLFDIEYSVIKVSEVSSGSLRIESEFFDVAYLNRDVKITSKKWDYLENIANKIDSWPAYSSDHIFQDYLIDRIPIVKIWDVTNKRWVESLDYVSKSEVKRFGNKYYQQSDLLLSMTGDPRNIGWVNVYYRLDKKIVFNQRVARLGWFENNHMNKYCFVFLNTEYARYHIERYAMWIRQRNVSIYDIEKLKVPIPSESFQKKIEELVVEAYEEKEKSESLYKEAENTLLEELDLLDFQPTTKEFNIFDQVFSIENSTSIVKYSDLIDVDRFDAEYWDNKYLEIEDKIKGYAKWYDSILNLSTLSKDKIRIKNENMYNYIELADINKTTWLVENTTEILWENLPSRARMKIKKWDILMSSLEGSIDKIAIVDFEKENLVASTWFYIFREWFLNKETLLVLLKFLWSKYIVREALGTIMSAISDSWLKNILLPKVDKQIQETIANKIQESFVAKEQSKKLLEVAKRGVEIYIEETEERGLRYIQEHYK